MRTRGYRAAVLAGLVLYGAGALLFWPAAAASYAAFPIALFAIASGLGFLETFANPLVAKLGPPETAAPEALARLAATDPATLPRADAAMRLGHTPAGSARAGAVH